PPARWAGLPRPAGPARGAGRPGAPPRPPRGGVGQAPGPPVPRREVPDPAATRGLRPPPVVRGPLPAQDRLGPGEPRRQPARLVPVVVAARRAAEVFQEVRAVAVLAVLIVVALGEEWDRLAAGGGGAHPQRHAPAPGEGAPAS